MTQRDFANALGLSCSYVFDIEAGSSSPRYKTLLAIARALGVRVGLLGPGAASGLIRKGDADIKELARNIRDLRLARGMLQVDLARSIGLTISHVCGLEHGRRAPPYTTLVALSRALGVPLMEITQGNATFHPAPVYPERRPTRWRPGRADFVQVGRNIATLRRERGITQTDLALWMGVSSPYLAYIESAKRPPSLKALFGLARILCVRVGDLLSGDGVGEARRRLPRKNFPDDNAALFVLAENIAFLRKSRGLSRQALASSSGLSRPNLGYIERAIKRPQFKTLLVLAHALKVPVAELFGDL